MDTRKSREIISALLDSWVVCGRCLSSTQTHRPMEWKRDRCVTSRRPIVPLYRSFCALAGTLDSGGT
ncbi:hypothetical protein EVAR_4474_1 [Eumeta japonica]|uniref:Uncharacterized protein n=1 Tax=Eumeta variegata TaxID=151549 RepID=A0A4C1T1B9_EUMVA|nr:hypothetical protein EVAR_4474_1 [Eumeta japonica]